jgi:predicted DsbA family dithiol-disulfide isomerase
VWRPFQLNPDMPLDGMDRQQYLNTNFGSEESARSVYQNVEDEGKKIKFFFNLIRLQRHLTLFFLISF